MKIPSDRLLRTAAWAYAIPRIGSLLLIGAAVCLALLLVFAAVARNLLLHLAF